MYLKPLIKPVPSEMCEPAGYEYDLVVIGGGAGGLACAKEAMRNGAKKVLVLDSKNTNIEWGPGGTCVNAGCMPVKLMSHAAYLSEGFQDAIAYGWKLTLEDKSIDWNHLTAAVQHCIKELQWNTRVDLRNQHVELVHARGHIKDAHTVKAVSPELEKEITAKHILVAVGSQPIIPDIPGAHECGITTDHLFSLNRAPGKTLVVGAGAIAVECACFLRGLGFETSIIFPKNLLDGFDRQMSDLVADSMLEKQISLIKGNGPDRLDRQNNQKILTTYSTNNWPRHELFDTIVFANGREAALGQMQLELNGIVVSQQKIVVDGSSRTSVPSIFSVGDCALGHPEFASAAIMSGRAIARRMFANSQEEVDFTLCPRTVLASIEYAFVGLNEEDAHGKMGSDQIEVFHGKFQPTEFMIPHRSNRNCYLKAIVQRDETQRVLGLHFAGPSAGEVLQGFAVAMQCGLTMMQLQNAVGIHPTSAQEFVRLSQTKRLNQDPSKQSCCN